ncbi:glycosyltransferase family 2 protein [Sedimentimonas flavescens]|uniref:glycosyltransferase family 2 protein n=1 Tax=Sedimentimonas flavescens TaxID=2851012 RepID=UPI001C4A729A|nr:glycosyltransferase family A protein [Sedimentimonas flavescens]MBW0159690.1 glycosyltransferase family 2 protein [Sedimentimonas flavescens]
MPGYSVIIPAFNAARTLAEALASVCAQRPAPAEVIVVDDGSSDQTAVIAREFGGPVRVLSQANAGPGAATMAGVRSAGCEVLAFLDADDLWLPGKIARQFEKLEVMGAGGIVCTRMRQFRHGIPDDGTGEVRDGLSRSTMLTTRAVFDQVGPIVDPPGRRGELIDWMARAREAGCRIEVLPDVLALRRILPGSLSWGRDPVADRGYLLAAHAALMRRRKQGGEP